jgi:hypothetical protein
MRAIAAPLVLCAFVSFAWVGGASSSLAEEPDVATVAKPAESYPSLSGELSIEIQNDRTYRAEDDDDRELNDLFTKTEPAFSLAFSESFSIEMALTFEPIEDPEPSKNREFNKEGLFVEQLFAKWGSDALEIYAGKFNVHFAKGYDDALGLYGIDFPEDYEITERIGAGVAYDLGGEAIGSHVLSFESFFADTTNLSRSIGRGRGRVRRSDGGPSNTGRLNSYGLALDGAEIPALPGLTYTLGFVYMSDGRADGDRLERDYVAGATYARALSDRLGLELFGEYVYQDNPEGVAARLRRYLTGSAALTYDALELALSYTNRDDAIPDDRNLDDFLLGASIGYSTKLGPGDARFELGYKLTREQNLKVGVAGGRITYVTEF